MLFCKTSNFYLFFPTSISQFIGELDSLLGVLVLPIKEFRNSLGRKLKDNLIRVGKKSNRAGRLLIWATIRRQNEGEEESHASLS